MPTFFSKVFRKDGAGSSSKPSKNATLSSASLATPQKPRWEDAWTRTTIEPDEVQALVRGCTTELKSRALDLPFLLLPFRPTSDPSGARTFIRTYFSAAERGTPMREEQLHQELRLTEPMVLCSVMKWCWSRLPGGVVTWEAYELFRVGEKDSEMARDSFATFIPLSVDSDARTKIIFDFFDLMAAIAAHGKTNGMGGRKLSRLAGWWAFEHSDAGSGFDGGYKSWASAADATSHLFFAYLRSLSPGSVKGTNGISALPISLQSLVQATEYPPETPSLMQHSTSRVVMIVDAVSPTPFALLRRAKHFDYRDDDPILKAFADLDDPIQGLTEECQRVLKCISSTNQSQVSSTQASTGLGDASWSRFEDIGFSGLMEESDRDDGGTDTPGSMRRRGPHDGLSSKPHSRMQDGGRPTTPSWADFLSAGFADDPSQNGPAPLMLPPDKVLPPIDTYRVRSAESNRRMDENLEPGELASINKLDLDDCFWWVWITSLAGEEPTERKAVFGRCALIETNIRGGKWLVMEEKVKGAAPAPEEGAYVVEKKSRFTLTKRGKLTRGRSSYKKKPSQVDTAPYRPQRNDVSAPSSKVSIGPDQHARIQAAAAALQQKQKENQLDSLSPRRGRTDEGVSTRTNSVFTLQPVILNEAAPAMKWANKFDKDTIRAAYLGNDTFGKGSEGHSPTSNGHSNGDTRITSPVSPHADRELPALPEDKSAVGSTNPPLPPDPVSQPPPPLISKPSAAEVPLPAEPTPQVVVQHSEAEHLAAVPTNDLIEPSTSQLSTPEKKAKGNKLKKNNPGGGLKKLFRKKPAEGAPQPSNVPAAEHENGSVTPQKPGTASSYGSEAPSHQSTAIPAPNAPSAHIEVPPHEPAQSRVPSSVSTPVQSPRLETVEPHYEKPTAATFANTPESPRGQIIPEPTPRKADIKEEQAAAKAFSSFDQGPLDDVPAFVPEDTSEPEAPEPKIEPQVVKQEPAPIPEPAREAPPIEDRWAQIRKNAAQRAANRDTNRESEEQSRLSQGTRTDDGETSEQETIESRVARIKARVAQLTGNMEGQPTSDTPAR